MRRQVLNLVLAGWCVAQAAGNPVKKPVYLDCFPNKVMVYPGEKAVSWEELQRPGNAVEQLVAGVEARKAESYVIILARPNSVKFYRKVRRFLSQRPVDVGYEAVDDGNVGLWNMETGHLLVGKDKQAIIVKIDRPTNRSPVFFECRDNQVFYVDREGLDAQVQRFLKTLPNNIKSRDLQALITDNGKNVGNKYYKVIPQYLLTAIIALEPRPGVKGEDPAALEQPDSEFKKALGTLDQTKQYVVFLVRDNAFAAFHAVRQSARLAGLQTNWELMANDEPLKFGVSGGCTLSP